MRNYLGVAVITLSITQPALGIAQQASNAPPQASIVGIVETSIASLKREIASLRAEADSMKSAIAELKSREHPIPREAIVLVSSGDCSVLGQNWAKLEQAQGRFIVGAGPNSDHNVVFGAGVTGRGQLRVQVEQRNLPALNVNIPYVLSNVNIGGDGYDIVRAIANKGGDKVDWYTATIKAGEVEPIDVSPPWIGLTACRKI